MRDRVPTPGKENRVKITQDSSTAIEGVLAYADDATQEGSPYTKGNVLPDEVCDLMSLDHNSSEPRDAFCYLALMQASVYGKIVVTVTSNGLPMVGINFTIGSHSVTTNSQGQASVIVSPGNYTATFSNTLDLIFSPASMQVTATKGKITYYSVTASEASTTQRTFTSSTSISFSDRVSDFDVFCVGGGGSGGAACAMHASSNNYCWALATGGAGGKTATVKNIVNTGNVITIVVGAGGNSVTATIDRTNVSTSVGASAAGNSGGESYVSINSIKICSADGGASGNGSYTYSNMFYGADGSSGGSGSGAVSYTNEIGDGGYDGNDGEGVSSLAGGTGQGSTTREFGLSYGAMYSPAGAGARVRTDGSPLTGNPGTNGGTATAIYGSSTSITAHAYQGSVVGAGGGGCVISNNLVTSTANFIATSGAGYRGVVIIKWRYN